MLTFWVVVVKMERTAEITAPTVPESGILDADGRSTAPATPTNRAGEDNASLKDYMEIRLIN